jgi:hypothetical protein
MLHPFQIAGALWRSTRSTGLASGLLSAAVLAWRGTRERGRPLAPLNAPSHWFWGERALRRDGASWRYTAVGMLTHQASSMLWAGVYAVLQRRRPRRTPATVVIDAAAVASVAAVVDLAVVPKRLTPGFERRLTRQGLVWVYAAFAAGLALGGLATLRRR